MEIHDHLYALGLRLGRDVFDDADGFRGALDDYLDESAASTGDINLLVDAVRLGAFRSMLTMLDSGADVTRAIDEAGTRLARDRGSVDVAGAQWACAVLGFAVGRVGDPDVRRYRSQHPPAPGAAPTILPSGPPPPPPYVSPPHLSPPHVSPAHVSPAPPYAPSSPGPQAFAQQSWTPPTPPRKRKVWPIVLAVVVVVALIAGGGAFFLVTNGDDDDREAGPGKSDGPTSDGPTTETDPGGTDFESVNARYSALASQVTSGTNECESVTTVSGETEHLDCAFANGTLSLATYGSRAELEAGRGRQVTLEAGGVYDTSSAGTILGFEVNDADARPTEAFLYWDDNATQSATYVAETGVDLDQLVRLQGATDPVVAYPKTPSDPAMIDFVDQWFLINGCERIQTVVADQLEESYCNINGPIDVYIGKFASRAKFLAYRRDIRNRARVDGREPQGTWNQKQGDPIQGSLLEYTTDENYTALYWDKTDCLCYAEAFLLDSTYDRLKTWWET